MFLISTIPLRGWEFYIITRLNSNTNVYSVIYIYLGTKFWAKIDPVSIVQGLGATFSGVRIHYWNKKLSLFSGTNSPMDGHGWKERMNVIIDSSRQSREIHLLVDSSSVFLRRNKKRGVFRCWKRSKCLADESRKGFQDEKSGLAPLQLIDGIRRDKNHKLASPVFSMA